MGSSSLFWPWNCIIFMTAPPVVSGHYSFSDGSLLRISVHTVNVLWR
jgi:hypothetical protein